MSQTWNGPAPSPTGTGPETSAPTKVLGLAPQDTAEGRPILGAEPLTWAAELIAAAGDQTIPLYGSPEWRALPANSSLRVAACVRAAEAWRTYWSPEEHQRRLRAEIDEARQAAFDDAWQWLAQRVKGAGRPRFSQLCDRRGEPERAERARAIEQALGLEVVA